MAQWVAYSTFVRDEQRYFPNTVTYKHNKIFPKEKCHLNMTTSGRHTWQKIALWSLRIFLRGLPIYSITLDPHHDVLMLSADGRKRIRETWINVSKNVIRSEGHEIIGNVVKKNSEVHTIHRCFWHTYLYWSFSNLPTVCTYLTLHFYFIKCIRYKIT